MLINSVEELELLLLELLLELRLDLLDVDGELSEERLVLLVELEELTDLEELLPLLADHGELEELEEEELLLELLEDGLCELFELMLSEEVL